MVIGPTSPLRQLPAGLNRRQMLFFDGIRVAIDMADLAYARLEEVLTRLANHDFPQEEVEMAMTVAFQDAWTIVDSVNRLRVLLKKLPNFKQRAPSLQVLYRHINLVEELRHTVQHLDTQINLLEQRDLSVWGTLRWFVLVDRDQLKYMSGTLASGSQFGAAHEIAQLKPGQSMYGSTDHITLLASELSANLSEIMRALGAFIPKLEGVLAPQFQGLPTAIGNLLLVAHIRAIEDDKPPAGGRPPDPGEPE